MRLSLKDVRSIEVEALLSSCNISRKHSSLQDSLATATYLSDLSDVCSRVGLDIEASAQNEVADALWDQGEHSTSIRMLRRLTEMPPPQLKSETDQSHRSKLLAKLVCPRNSYSVPPFSDLNRVITLVKRV
jgi:serine-protein kinase ATM